MHVYRFSFNYELYTFCYVHLLQCPKSSSCFANCIVKWELRKMSLLIDDKFPPSIKLSNNFFFKCYIIQKNINGGTNLPNFLSQWKRTILKVLTFVHPLYIIIVWMYLVFVGVRLVDLRNQPIYNFHPFPFHCRTLLSSHSENTLKCHFFVVLSVRL